MQAITVKYFPATNAKPSRLRVKAQAKTQFVSYDGELGYEKEARKAAQDFAFSLGWTGTYHGGTLPNGDTVFVCGDNRPHTCTFFRIQRGQRTSSSCVSQVAE